jgi:hypothetical protein
MKVHKRSIPMDGLCFEHKGYTVRLFPHRNKVTVTIEKDDRILYDEWLTPEQLISLLMRDARP